MENPAEKLSVKTFEHVLISKAVEIYLLGMTHAEIPIVSILWRYWTTCNDDVSI